MEFFPSKQSQNLDPSYTTEDGSRSFGLFGNGKLVYRIQAKFLSDLVMID